MAYAEFLRVRTSIAWHAAILAAIVVGLLILDHGTHVQVNGNEAFPPSMLKLSDLAPIGDVLCGDLCVVPRRVAQP